MKLHLKNFRCYEDKTLDFGEKGLSLLSGPSGCGKSTILLAINFALYGKGNKLTSYGKTSCSVELQLGDTKILRTKRPNRLVVNDSQEDKTAQEIINKKFGNTFDVTGYIAQNAINSFIMMSPIEKLEFLETFAFKDVKLGELKAKCKQLINQRCENLNATLSQLELAENMFSELEEPEDLKFPVKCAKHQREKAKAIEMTKLKNSRIRMKRSSNTAESMKEKLTDLKVLQATLKTAEEQLETNRGRLEISRERLESIPEPPENALENARSRLKLLLSQKEYNQLANTVKQDSLKLEKMKADELDTMREKIVETEKELEEITSELTKEDAEEAIENTRIVLKDSQKLEQLRREIAGLGSFDQNIDDLEGRIDEIKSSLESFRNAQAERQKYNCPSCDTGLRFKDNKLVIFDSQSEDGEISCMSDGEIDEQVSEKESLLPLLEKKLSKAENVKEKRASIEEEINMLREGYEEEIPSSEEAIETIEEMKDHVRLLTNLGQKLEALEKNLAKENFSKTLREFEKNLERQQEKMDRLEEDMDQQAIDPMEEEQIRQTVSEMEKILYQRQELEQTCKSIEKENKVLEKKLLSEESKYLSKYEKIEELSDIQKRIESACVEKSQHERDMEKHAENLALMEKFSANEKLQQEYEKRKAQIEELKALERERRDLYTTAMLFRDKVLEAESIAMVNVISCINTHCQPFLESFFPDNPITIRLITFKESKKSKKPQINLEIDYKGMECDLSMLSGGELSRVILAFTLALGEMFNTPLLLLDESTASLDQEMTSVVFESIRENLDGKLVVVIAHQVTEGEFDNVIKMA